MAIKFGRRVPGGPTPYRPFGLRWTNRIRGRFNPWTPLELIGHQLHFATQAMKGSMHAVRQYRSTTMATFTDLTWGNGRSVIVGGGVAPVLVVMGVAVGAMLGILGSTALSTLGVGPIAGAISAIGNTRELAPIIAGVGFAAQAGCRMTAEIGAMRISEEIDALDAQAIRPIPFVVSTRVVACIICIIPTYIIALALSYIATAASMMVFAGQGGGPYSHYFHMFTSPTDVLYSLIKVVVFVVAVTIAHCYYGFYASGGPEGVGIASGRAIRASLILIIVLDMVLTIAMWGFSASISFGG